MIIITDEKLVIELEHPCPSDVIHDIQHAIITSLQHVNYGIGTDIKEIQTSNYFMLELLKQTLRVKD